MLHNAWLGYERDCVLPWRLLGAEIALQFPLDFEPPCELLLERVDVTAGPNYQPASRTRPPRPRTE